MAVLKDGMLVGKLGSVVGCRWKGKPYLRRIPVRTSPPTQAELVNRHIFGLVNAWLRPIHEFVKVGFRNYRPSFWGVNAACSVLHKTALHKDGFNSSIDPALVQVSHGSLGLSDDLQVMAEGDSLLFTWEALGRINKGPRDRIMLLAYNIEAGWARQEISGSSRYQGSHSLSLAQAPPGTYHLYAAFVAEDGSRQSSSRYLGEVSI